MNSFVIGDSKIKIISDVISHLLDQQKLEKCHIGVDMRT